MRQYNPLHMLTTDVYALKQTISQRITALKANNVARKIKAAEEMRQKQTDMRNKELVSFLNKLRECVKSFKVNDDPQTMINRLREVAPLYNVIDITIGGTFPEGKIKVTLLSETATQSIEIDAYGEVSIRNENPSAHRPPYGLARSANDYAGLFFRQAGMHGR